MVWIRKTGNGEGGGGAGPGAEEKEIATNTQLSHEFKSNNRYHVSEEVLQRNVKYRFTLTITGTLRPTQRVTARAWITLESIQFISVLWHRWLLTSSLVG